MPASQPTVFLHIGVAKTGTTYLQSVLWHNRRTLERQGLRYAARHPADHFRASVDLRQRPFAGEHATLVPGAWDVTAELAAEAPDRAVVSHETLTRTRTAQVRRAAESLRTADLHVVLTLRDLGRQVPAVWQEQVKNRSVVRYEQFLHDIADRPDSRPHRHFWEAQDVLGVLQRWGTAVPPEKVHVVTVPQPGAAAGLLWERFAWVLGVDPRSVDTDVPTSNVSLGVVEAELLRRLNAGMKDRMDWPTYEAQVKRRLSERLAARSSSPRLAVPAERRTWVKEQAQRIVDGLHAGGYDVVGDLDELLPVFDDRPVVMPADVPVGRLMRLAGESLADVLSEDAARQPPTWRTLLPPPGSRTRRLLRRLTGRG
jgi:hypothetical protein